MTFLFVVIVVVCYCFVVALVAVKARRTREGAEGKPLHRAQSFGGSQDEKQVTKHISTRNPNLNVDAFTTAKNTRSEYFSRKSAVAVLKGSLEPKPSTLLLQYP